MEGRNKRIAVLLVVFAALAAIVAGTAGARVDTKSAGTLDIYGYGPGDDVQENRATYAAQQLNGVTIKREAPGFDDQAFLTRLASGQVPDLVRMGRPSVGLYAAKGVLQPVNSCVSNALIKQYRAGAIRAMTWKGKLYGLPEFTNQVTLIVNKSALASAGVPESAVQMKNLGALLKTSKKLTKFDSSGNLTRIGFDPDFLGGFLVTRFDLDGVIAGLNQGTARAKIVSGGHRFELFGRRLGGRVIAQIPAGAVDAGGCRAIELTNDFAVFVGDGDFDLALFYLGGLFFFLVGGLDGLCGLLRRAGFFLPKRGLVFLKSSCRGCGFF